MLATWRPLIISLHCKMDSFERVPTRTTLLGYSLIQDKTSGFELWNDTTINQNFFLLPIRKLPSLIILFYSSPEFSPRILNLDLSLALTFFEKRTYSSFVTKGPKEPDLPTTSPPAIHEPPHEPCVQHTWREKRRGQKSRLPPIAIALTSLAQFQRPRNRRPPRRPCCWPRIRKI